MISTEGTTLAAVEAEDSEMSGSFQRLVALLVDSSNLRVEADPLLALGDDDRADELELRLYSL